jgi:hypothetical protein
MTKARIISAIMIQEPRAVLWAELRRSMKQFFNPFP